MAFANPDDRREYQREYMRQYRLANREKALAQGRKDAAKFRERFPEKVKEQIALYGGSERGKLSDKLSKAQARARNRQFLAEIKSNPCTRCGEEYHPAAMEFHHLDPKDKTAAVATLAGWGRSLDILKTEIAKCILLCANCHKIVTWEHIYGKDTVLRSIPPRKDRRRRRGNGRSEEDLGKPALQV